MAADTALWMRYRWSEASSRHCQLQGRQLGTGGCRRKSFPGVEQERSSQLAPCEASGKSFNELLGSYV